MQRFVLTLYFVLACQMLFGQADRAAVRSERFPPDAAIDELNFELQRFVQTAVEFGDPFTPVVPASFDAVMMERTSGIDDAFVAPDSCDADAFPLENSYAGGSSTYCWQRFPEGLLFHSYIAGEKEPRFALAWLNQNDFGPIVECALGGRVGLFRYGTCGAIDPQGWQWDLEGAALPRLQSSNSDLVAVDFRFGTVLTHRAGPLAYKVGYYHLSSHLGDEWLLSNNGFHRINYVRDALLTACRYRVRRDLEVYGEAALAPAPSGGAKPLEFQFGLQFDPPGYRGTPFAAANAHLREEFDFGGSINILAGWQWRSPYSGRVFRIGGQFYHGPSMQYSFLHQRETLAGAGIWFDY